MQKTWTRPFVVLCASALVAGCRQEPPADSARAALAVPVALRLEPSAVLRDDTSHWPGFRGGASGGVSRASELPEQFAPASAAWAVAVPGDGNSSPVVWDDRVFLTSRVSDRGRPELAVFCFDRKTGRMVWRRELAVPAGVSHPKNGHASATVVTDGRRVIASLGAQGLYCLDHDGQVLWSVGQEGARHQWGTASSPVWFDRYVILVSDGSEGSSIAAYDTESGELAWRRDRDSYGSWSTPVVLFCDTSNRFELIVNGTGTANGSAGRVIAYDPSSGRPLWSVLGTTDIPCATAIVGDGVVVSTSGSNGPIMAIRPGGSGDVTDTSVLWKLADGGPQVPTGLILDRRLYLITDGGVLSCHDAATGEERWSSRLRRRFSASLVAGDGKVYATSEDGRVYAVAAADEYRLLATSELGERCLATPAVVDGQLLIRTARHLYAFRKQAALAAHAAPSPPDVLEAEEAVDAR